MQKIVHIGKYYPPDNGGIESVTKSLACGAASIGYEVTVICFAKTSTHYQEMMEGVRVIRTPINKMIASQPLGLKYFALCWKMGRSADLVHLHVPNMLGALCALLIGKTPRLLVHWHSDVLNKGILGRLLRPLENALLKRADCIVSTSQIYADTSPTLKPFHSKVVVVPIGIPDATKHAATTATEMATASGALPQKLIDKPQTHIDKISGKKLILSVGRLVPYKGFDVLIAAAPFIRDDTLIVIVGGGPLEDQLQNSIRTSKLTTKVLMTGKISDEMLHTLFSKASLYCLPSTYRAEAFGVVLLEAMAYRLPIVASDIPGSGVSWVNQHGVSGFNVPVGDAMALADACNRILSSETEHAKLSQGARARFEAEFTEQVSVQKILHSYENMM